MATVNCPHGHRWISTLTKSRVTFENRTVTILDGICDSCDRCGFTGCEYFDDSREATRRFQKVQAMLHSDLGFREQDQHYALMLRQKHRPG